MPTVSVMPLSTHARSRDVGPGEWAILEYCAPGGCPRAFGVLLWDIAADRLHFKFRAISWHLLNSDEDAGVMELIPEYLCEKAKLLRGSEVLAWLEDNASHTIRLTQRQEIAIDQIRAVLSRLYREHLSVTGRVTIRSNGCVGTVVDTGRRLWAGYEIVAAIDSTIYWATAGVFGVLFLTLIHLHEHKAHSFPEVKHRMVQAVEEDRRSQLEWSELPILYNLQRQPAFLSLGAEVPAAHTGHRSRNTVRKRLHAKRKFNAGTVVVKAPTKRPTLAAAPAIETSSPIPAEFFVTSLPAVSYNRRRRNGFVRVLNMLTVPFRTLARTVIRN